MVAAQQDVVMTDPGRDTHFGYQIVDIDAKQGMIDDVFRSVARRYDLMNDLMSGGLHRAWKDALVSAVKPPHSARGFSVLDMAGGDGGGGLRIAGRGGPRRGSARGCSVLDMAGGTGDVALRIAYAGGPGTRVTVCDINRDMLEVGRQRAVERDLAENVSFMEGNAESLIFPDKSFD